MTLLAQIIALLSQAPILAAIIGAASASSAILLGWCLGRRLQSAQILQLNSSTNLNQIQFFDKMWVELQELHKANSDKDEKLEQFEEKLDATTKALGEAQLEIISLRGRLDLCEEFRRKVIEAGGATA